MAGALTFSGTFPDGTAANFTVQYNDSLQVISLECDNQNTSLNAFCEIVAVDQSGNVSPTAVYGQSFPPNAPGHPTVLACQTSPANKVITLTANPARPGHYLGMNVTMNLPG